MSDGGYEDDERGAGPCDCVIEEILQEDGALVSFGEPLLRYREG